MIKIFCFDSYSSLTKLYYQFQIQILLLTSIDIQEIFPIIFPILTFYLWLNMKMKVIEKLMEYQI